MDNQQIVLATILEIEDRYKQSVLNRLQFGFNLTPVPVSFKKEHALSEAIQDEIKEKFHCLN